MNPIQRFGEYAAAFEKVFESDDWSLLDPYFTEEAVYELHGEAPFSGRYEGRDTVFAYLRQSLDAFDRRFDARELELLEGPALRDGAVWIRWRGTYRRAGAPALAVEGEEKAFFQGDRIRRLEDHFAPGSGAATLAFLTAHGAKLRPVVPR